MFDLTTFGNALTIEQLAVNVTTTENFDIQVYTKSDTYSGFENDSSAWTLVATGTGVGQGGNNPSLVDITDFNLSANTVTGIYINYLNPTVIRYNFGNGTNQTYSNSDLRLDLGIAKTDLFGGTTFSPRVWNGTIFYSINSPTPVPEPLTIMGTILAGSLGIAFKKKQSAKL